MEENFEKKSGKKAKIIIPIVVLLLIAAVVAGALYLNYSRRPEQIFSKAIDEAFEVSEKDEARKAKIDLEFSLKMDSDDYEIATAKEILKSVKLKSTTEIDIDKKVFNENLKAFYGEQEIVGADALIQEDAIYFFLDGIYSKYIEIPEEYLEGVELSTMFDVAPEYSPKKLVNDVKKVLLDEVKSREITKENVELDGKNVQKSTLKLTPEEVLEITVKLLEVINEHQPTAELEELILDLKDEIEYADDTENYVEVSIYTSGLTNKIVKAEVILVDAEYDETILLELVKKSDDETKIGFSINDEELIEITLTSTEEDKGTVKLKINIDEYNSATLKVKYEFDYDVEINKRYVSNSISADKLTDADYTEMYENIEDNTILYSIIQNLMLTEDDYYEYEEDDYYYDYDYEDNYINYDYMY